MKYVLNAEDLEIAKMLNEGLTGKEISSKLGISMRTVLRRKAMPQLKAHLSAVQSGRHRAITKINREKIEAMAEEETEKHMAKVGLTSITPVLLLNRLLELALLSPERTRGNIVGQQQAVDSIWTKMGFQGDAPRIDDLRNAAPDVYQAEWLRKPQ